MSLPGNLIKGEMKMDRFEAEMALSKLIEERKLAVDAARNTIRYAKMFGAKAVVVHAGRVQIKDMTKNLGCETIVSEEVRITAGLAADLLPKQEVETEPMLLRRAA